MKKTIFVLLFVMFIISISPTIIEASWWNPFSWFKKPAQILKIPATAVVSLNETSQNTMNDVKKKENTNTIKKPVLSMAQCLKNSGAVFYGAFWCSHCNAQKTLFGDSAKDLPYVECSTPDKKGQTEICKKNNIQAYPTWRFKDGSETMGAMTLEDLAKKTGCALDK